MILGGLSWILPLVVCATGPTVPGIDVSVYQGDIDWAKVKAAGIAFAFIRVSDGATVPDSKFARNWQGARAAGVVRGAYQFFRPAQDPKAQADLLLGAMGAPQPGDLPPVLDVEVADGQTAATIVARAQTWSERVQNATGRRPIIYTARWFWDVDAGASRALAAQPLWVAQWGVACPDLPVAWNQWTFWQKSATGTVSGIAGHVDLDAFNGDRAALAAFAGCKIGLGGSSRLATLAVALALLLLVRRALREK